MTKKLHPADIADREAVAQATGFNVHLRRSPTSKINEPAASLAKAATIADRLSAENHPRKAMIYAVLPDSRSIPVPADMIDAARSAGVKPARRASAATKAKGGRKTPAKGKTAAKAPKPATGKRAAILEAAQAGKLPPVPDFSAPTHARFRKKLDEVVALAKAGDVKALKAFAINPVSTSPKAIARYRDLAVTALEART